VRPNYDFYQDPATGIRGMLAHIAANSLAPGRHLLVVTTDRPGEAPAARRAQYIPFWR